VIDHRTQRLLDRVIGADGDGLAVADAQLTRLDGRGVLALREHLHDDVAVGQHALEAVVLAADRHRADVELGEPLRGVEDAVALPDARCSPGS